MRSVWERFGHDAVFGGGTATPFGDLGWYCIAGHWLPGRPCFLCHGPAAAVSPVDATHWTCATCGHGWESRAVDA